MVTIFADTTSSLPLDMLKSLGIPTLPQFVIFGTKQYQDDGEMDTTHFLQMLKSSPSLPKTSAPSPDLYRPLYKKYTENGGSVIVIAPSEDVSGTYRGAMVAKEDFPDADIRVIDTRTIASGLGSIVLKANEWATQGMNADEIEKRVRELCKRQKVFFMVDTLDYLYKGGRIGGASHLFGSILQIKPILTVKDGKVDTADKQQTKKKAIAKIISLVKADCAKDGSAMVSVMHCDALLDAEELKLRLQQELNVLDIPIYLLPSAIVVHAGPKALAVSYFTA
jgi:DegV family protein with EDD domain